MRLFKPALIIDVMISSSDPSQFSLIHISSHEAVYALMNLDELIVCIEKTMVPVCSLVG